MECIQCSHQERPWGVPWPPLLRNRGPLRTLEGQSYSKWSVTWSSYLIQYGARGVYDSITMHTPFFTTYVGTTKLTAIKLKTESFDNLFFIHLNKQNAGVLGWPLKLLQSPYSKVRFTSSLALRPNGHPNGRIFVAYNAPSQLFLWESCKTTAWWEHWMHPSILHKNDEQNTWKNQMLIVRNLLKV